MPTLERRIATARRDELERRARNRGGQGAAMRAVIRRALVAEGVAEADAPNLALAVWYALPRHLRTITETR